ncbi:hypothetical protein Tco_0154018 [Tanacetum coccineum]
MLVLTLNLLSEKAQGVTITDCHAGNPCVHICDPTAKANDPIIEGMDSRDWVDNDIYSTIDACPNACEMWKAIERLKQGESINVQDLETNLYRSLENSHHGMVNHLNRITQELQRFVTLVKQSQELKTISYHKLYDILKQYQNKVNELRAERLAHTANPLALVAQQQLNPTLVAEMMDNVKEKEMNKTHGFNFLYHFKKIYNYQSSTSDTSSNNQLWQIHDNTPRINRGTRYDNQRAVNIARAREGEWDGHDDEPDDQELEAYYMYMAQIQEVTPNAADNSGPIFDVEPLQKGQGGTNITIDSLDMSTNRETVDQDDDDLANERDLLSSLIEKLKYFKTKNKSLESSNNHFKEANNELPKTNQLMFKDLKKFQAELEGILLMTKIPMAVPISTREHKRNVNQSTATPLKRIVAAESTNQKPRSTIKKQYEQIILGYGNLVKGKVTIKRVYYVKGLNHNLFSIGHFCDADLDVAFRKST